LHSIVSPAEDPTSQRDHYQFESKRRADDPAHGSAPNLLGRLLGTFTLSFHVAEWTPASRAAALPLLGWVQAPCNLLISEDIAAQQIDRVSSLGGNRLDAVDDPLRDIKTRRDLSKTLRALRSAGAGAGIRRLCLVRFFELRDKLEPIGLPDSVLSLASPMK